MPHDPDTWRSDPVLAGLFHVEHPDDLQVVCHDGEPRRTGLEPEACWVTVTGVSEGPARPVALVKGQDAAYLEALSARDFGPLDRIYEGVLLNQPHRLTSIKKGDRVRFIVSPGLALPLLVTGEYLEERPHWHVTPCNRCGFQEGLDPPSTMARTCFPGTPAGVVMMSFTSSCPFCDGTQIFGRSEQDEGGDEEDEEDEEHSPESDRRLLEAFLGEPLPKPAEPPPAPPAPGKPWWKFWS